MNLQSVLRLTRRAVEVEVETKAQLEARSWTEKGWKLFNDRRLFSEGRAEAKVDIEADSSPEREA